MSLDLYDRIWAAVQKIEADGKPEFTPKDVSSLLDGDVPIRKIKEVLLELWTNGAGIYTEVVGGALWYFGHKPPPNSRRKPIGSRR